MIKAIIGRNKDGQQQSSSHFMTLAQSLLNANEEKNSKEIDQMEQDKETQMERIKLQIVAENEAEVQ
jgi:hypothetical protein